MTDQVSARVTAVLARVLDLPAQTHVDMSDDLSAPPLEVDSLRLLELVVQLEQEFGVRIDDADVYDAKLRTVGDLVGLVLATVAVETG